MPPPVLPPCPHLPEPRAGLDWRLLAAHRSAHRRSDFYRDCLEYAHSLWIRGLAARSVLCLDRAFGAELSGNEPVLREWPLPYGALVWILGHTPADVFLGNPRVHFQHYADRLNEPRRAERRSRAWACWALVRAARPEFPGDPRHRVREPSAAEIARDLEAFGHPGEAESWSAVLGSIVA
jgi:hypothetical protein